MYDKYFLVNSLSDAIELYSRDSEHTRIIAGGTDLVLEIERGLHPEIVNIVDISRINGLDEITIDEKNIIHIGPIVTHSKVVSSSIIYQYAKCLYQACEKVGSPQIRNRGTVVGNVATASPANDTISALIALNAKIIVSSKDGNRIIDLQNFFQGVRKTVLKPGEIITEIFFNSLNENEKSSFSKIALRNTQAISLANVTVILNIKNNLIIDSRVAMGAVSPTIVRAKNAEVYLTGKEPSEAVFSNVGEIASNEISPISDIRASEKYRKEMIAVYVKRALMATAIDNNKKMAKPVLLWGKETSINRPLCENSIEMDQDSILEININGKDFQVQNAFQKNLLDVIRENALLTGTKEGCGEGECGACTVYLDGIAVLACLIPAPRAHKSTIVTIEGIAEPEKLHVVQQSLIDEGAVQCGYCTPGFVMSAIKLLEEIPDPTQDEIKIGISGNLCRCTGYYKIISAIEKAAKG